MTHDQECTFDPKYCRDCRLQAEARADEREQAVQRIETLHRTREYDVDDVCCWTVNEHAVWLKAVAAVRGEQ